MAWEDVTLNPYEAFPAAPACTSLANSTPCNVIPSIFMLEPQIVLSPPNRRPPELRTCQVCSEGSRPGVSCWSSTCSSLAGRVTVQQGPCFLAVFASEFASPQPAGMVPTPSVHPWGSSWPWKILLSSNNWYWIVAINVTVGIRDIHWKFHNSFPRFSRLWGRRI